jgi:hypothetical protein
VLFTTPPSPSLSLPLYLPSSTLAALDGWSFSSLVRTFPPRPLPIFFPSVPVSAPADSGGGGGGGDGGDGGGEGGERTFGGRREGGRAGGGGGGRQTDRERRSGEVV